MDFNQIQELIRMVSKHKLTEFILREGDFKLIRNYDDDSLELYNLAADLGETRNLSATNPEMTQRLAAKLESWLKSSGARMPVPVPSKP